jgi:hypothetical protein
MGKDVCNHDVHFCTKASVPDKFNALQTCPMGSVDGVVYNKDEAGNDLLSLGDADDAASKWEKESKTQMAFQLKLQNKHITVSCEIVEERPKLSQ